MRTHWTTKGNRDASFSCSCDRGLHRYLQNFGGRGFCNPNPPPSVRHCPVPQFYISIKYGKKINYKSVHWTSFFHIFISISCTLVVFPIELVGGTEAWTNTRFCVQYTALGYWEMLMMSQKLPNVIPSQEWRPYSITHRQHEGSHIQMFWYIGYGGGGVGTVMSTPRKINFNAVGSGFVNCIVCPNVHKHRQKIEYQPDTHVRTHARTHAPVSYPKHVNTLIVKNNIPCWFLFI